MVEMDIYGQNKTGLRCEKGGAQPIQERLEKSPFPEIPNIIRMIYHYLGVVRVRVKFLVESEPDVQMANECCVSATKKNSQDLGSRFVKRVKFLDIPELVVSFELEVDSDFSKEKCIGNHLPLSPDKAILCKGARRNAIAGG